MIKTFATALILASTLAFGITDAQAHAAPKAYAALIGIKHDCKVEHGKAGRCRVTKHTVMHVTVRATIDSPIPTHAQRATTAHAIAASASQHNPS
jgi:hypothetical protein